MFIEASISGLNLNQFQNSIKQTKNKEENLIIKFIMSFG